MVNPQDRLPQAPPRRHYIWTLPTGDIVDASPCPERRERALAWARWVIEKYGRGNGSPPPTEPLPTEPRPPRRPAAAPTGPIQPPPDGHCPADGTVNPPGSRYCMRCGRRLGLVPLDTHPLLIEEIFASA